MSDNEEDHEISYVEDTNQIRFHLRRPVYLYVPDARVDEEYEPLVETSPPPESLELEWVYGYRGRDCRNNVLALASGEVVYFTAGVAVIYNIHEHSQRYYIGHSDDIKSIAVHPNGETVATGQIKGRDDEVDEAHIRVWNSNTLETMHVFGMGKVARGVNCLAFSRQDDGAKLAVVDDAPEPCISVWEWADEEMLCYAKCSPDPVLAVTFSMEDNPRIITSGKNSIMFWTITEDGSLKKRTGTMGKYPKPKYITTVAFTPDGDTISGDSNGNVVIWRKGSNEVSRFISGVHEGAVFCIVAKEAGDGYYSSGKDRIIKRWGPDFEPSEDSSITDEDLGGGRSIAEASGRLVVGTIKNGIVKGNIGKTWSVVTQGSTDEIWALATHPTEHQFLAGSYEGTLTERTTSGRSIMWTMDLKYPVQSCTYSPGGEVFVVGCGTGHWLVFDADTKEKLLEKQDGDEPLQVVRFSPDGSVLAIGSRDNKVYLYEAHNDFKEYVTRGVCGGHSSFIRCLDFSADGAYIMTNSGDYEQLFWVTEDCEQMVDTSDLRDTAWATRTCLLSFQNFGIWPKGVDGTELNAVTAGHEKPLVVTADDFGKVKLFKSDTHFAYTANKPYPGHSSHVTAVEFSYDDSYVISLGGADCSIMQWKVVDA